MTTSMSCVVRGAPCAVSAEEPVTTKGIAAPSRSAVNRTSKPALAVVTARERQNRGRLTSAKSDGDGFQMPE